MALGPITFKGPIARLAVVVALALLVLGAPWVAANVSSPTAIEANVR